MTSFYCLKAYNEGEGGCLKITKFERTYFMDGPISNPLGVRIRKILLY